MSDIDPTLKYFAEDVAHTVAREFMSRLNGGDVPLAPEYLTEAQVAQLTGFTPRGLEFMRSKGKGPPSFKIGTAVRYRAADVRAWIESFAEGAR